MPINEINTIYTPSVYGRTSFPLRHHNEPIFYKTFNAESSDIVDINQNTIYIPNHFFKTGEPLKYNIGVGVSIGIDNLSPGASGIINKFPSIVYPIVVDKDHIQISLGSTYATSNLPVNITSLGIGTDHSFECFKQNSKCLITINNVIQSPISIGSTVKILNYTQNSLVVESLQNIKIGTCLKVNQEIVKVSTINYDTKNLGISRGTTVLGTGSSTFSNSIKGSYADVLSGNYNIIEDIIYFDEPPLESNKISYRIYTSDIVYSNYSFNLLTDKLITGSQIFLLWNNPPKELQTSKFYYLIKNSDNNFSFANSYANAISGNKIVFTNNSGNEFNVTDFQIIYFYPSEENSFNGRVFLRSNYNGNTVFDDISEQFTGITSSFELKTSGIGTVGISSDNGILLIDNVFQYPGSDEAFSFVGLGTTGTAIDFVGMGTTEFLGKSYDVNVKEYPRGGIIVSYGTTSGSNYPASTSFSGIGLTGSVAGIGASISFNTDEYGNIKGFEFINRGYNYKVGEILIPLVGTQAVDNKLHITINETTKDKFNAWNIGILDKFDDLNDKVNGIRKTFSLTKNGQRISLDADSQYELELQYNLLIFVNDVLQTPNTAYTFTNGSIITFTEAIPTGSNVKIYLYKGYYGDTFLSSSISKLKEGDLLTVLQDIYSPPPVEEKQRIIKEFIGFDVLRTNVYSDIGISNNSSQLRSISWTPQNVDTIIDGSFVSKSRDEYNSNIGSFDILTKYTVVGLNTIGITTTSGTYTGLATSFIAVNTSVGIGTLIAIGDYVESTYTGVGVSIISIGSNIIGISKTSSENVSGIMTYSPNGTNTSILSFYRKS